MPTLFIAVQCCQCSTMQVKQSKRISNKWLCVVCNQKQSVRKVFAQGFMAKDIRKFVQSFNMSRHSSDQQFNLEEHQTTDANDRFLSNLYNKRTDWTEYLDLEVGNGHEQSTGDGLENRIVRELPEAVFKRPKLNNYSEQSESNSKKCFRPVMNKRNTRKQNTLEPKDMADGVPELEDITIASQDIPSWSNNRTIKAINNNVAANEISKWSEYLTIDEDDDISEVGSGSDKWKSMVLEEPLKDHKVDEDIHPDFM